MGWLFRLSNLVWLSVLLAVAAAVLWLWPADHGNRAVPLPLPDGDREVAWLDTANNVSDWGRFVRAARWLEQRGGLGLQVDATAAFPPYTTDVPEMILSRDDRAGRLRVRWYKLRGEVKAPQWVDALVGGRRPPMAIVGGGNTRLATELATRLQAIRVQDGRTDLPLLLLTFATSDEATGGEPLNDLYAGATYRFCFTNRQMAQAVTDFVWSQDDLRPDDGPLYLAMWDDDPYSGDLNERFVQAVQQMPSAQAAAARAATRDWAWLAGVSATGGMPIDLGGAAGTSFWMSALPVGEHVDYSFGGFSLPNPREAEAARDLIDELVRRPLQRRPLLVLACGSGQARRCLRALAQAGPAEARRFVVVTGDAISFNTVYRDRHVSWPVQDLPFPLVLFCHRNPTEPGQWVPDPAPGADSPRPAPAADEGSPATSTDDLLLYADILRGLVLSAWADGGLPANGDELGRRFDRVGWDGEQVVFDEGSPLFHREEDPRRGNRHRGTGEHVVCLRPLPGPGGRVLPQARVTVLAWTREAPPGQHWKPVRPRDVPWDPDLPGLVVEYEQPFRGIERPGAER